MKNENVVSKSVLNQVFEKDISFETERNDFEVKTNTTLIRGKSDLKRGYGLVGLQTLNNGLDNTKLLVKAHNVGLISESMLIKVSKTDLI